MSTFTHDGASLAYDDTGGGGTPLLLIHGIYVSRAQWRPQLEALDQRLRLIAVDLRGHGDSSRWPRGSEGEPACSVARLADDAAALLDHLKLEQAFVCGHSFGGFVAQELALRHPQRVRGLILAETLYGSRSTPLEDLTTRALFGLLSGSDPHRLGRVLARYFGSLSVDAAELLLHESRRHLDDPEALRDILSAALAFDSRWRLHRIRCPTLLVSGQVPQIPQVLAQAGEMWWRIPRARWTFVPCAGHLLHWDNPPAFNRRVVRFIDDVEADAA